MAPRSRNFDGCWTCRIRKVKCDGTRPVCLRCRKAARQCKGYNIVLAWADTTGVNSAGEMISVPMSRTITEDDRDGLRRNVNLVHYPRDLRFDRFDMLNKVMVHVDEQAQNLAGGSYFEGPFGVYVNGLGDVRSSPKTQNKMRPLGSTRKSILNMEQTQSLEHKQDELLEQTPGVYSAASTNGNSGPNRESPEENRPQSPDLDSMAVDPPNNTAPPHRTPFRTPVYGESGRAHAAGAPKAQTAQSSPNSARSSDLDSPGALEYQMAVDEPETSIFSETDNSYVHFDLLDSAKLTILAIKGPQFEFSEQSMFHILYPKFFPNIESDEWQPNTNVLVDYFELLDRGLVVKPLLTEFSSNLHSSLISFVRVSTPNDPWNRLVVPLIKEIVFELVCEDYARKGDFSSHWIHRDSEVVPRMVLIRNIKLAVLCMALASSGFQKSLMRAKAHVNAVNKYYLDEDMQRSIVLRKLGINMLNYHLDEYDNNSQFKECDTYNTYLMLALVLQIQLDNAYGVFENYELLFAIGDFILKRTKENDHTTTESYLRSVFHVLNVFYESTQAINFFNFSISENDRNLKYLDLNDNYDLTKDSSDERESDSDDDTKKNITVAARTDQSAPLSFTVFFSRNDLEKKSEEQRKQKERKARKTQNSQTHSDAPPVVPRVDDSSVYVSTGLPASLLQLLHEVTQLANHKNVFRKKGVAPRNFPRICAETEDRINNWSVEQCWKLYNTEYSPISNTVGKVFITRFHEALFYNVTAFHSALKVYFKRLIPAAPLQSYQDSIATCFDAMELLVQMHDVASGEAVFSPSFWPVLICGCDIDVARQPDLQKQCQRLWKYPCFTKYNYWRAKQILYEVWSRRSSENENNGFMDMIREWDIVLCLG